MRLHQHIFKMTHGCPTDPAHAVHPGLRYGSKSCGVQGKLPSSCALLQGAFCKTVIAGVVQTLPPCCCRCLLAVVSVRIAMQGGKKVATVVPDLAPEDRPDAAYDELFKVATELTSS